MRRMEWRVPRISIAHASRDRCRQKESVIMLILLSALALRCLGDAMHDTAQHECGGGEAVAEFRSLVSNHPWSGRAWEGLANVFADAGCVTDAMLAADVAARFYRACACEAASASEAAQEAQTRTTRVREDMEARFFEQHGGARFYFADDGRSSTGTSAARCCGARLHWEMGGSQPMLLGGAFDDATTQAAWHEAHQLCPRYFGQCQQTSPFSVVQQDMLLHMLFGDKVGGVFVDVGSVDGFSFSNTYFFERNLNWTGVCIEPNRASLPTLERVRVRAAVVNACVSNHSSQADFLQCTGYTRMLSGLLSAMTPEHHARIKYEIGLHGGSAEVIQVQVLRLGDILAAEGITEIDLLSIDTEGAEMTVLQGIDWTAVRISVIIVEMLNPQAVDSKGIRAYLQARGFRQHAYVCQDAVYTHDSFVPASKHASSCINIQD